MTKKKSAVKKTATKKETISKPRATKSMRINDNETMLIRALRSGDGLATLAAFEKMGFNVKGNASVTTVKAEVGEDPINMTNDSCKAPSTAMKKNDPPKIPAIDYLIEDITNQNDFLFKSLARIRRAATSLFYFDQSPAPERKEIQENCAVAALAKRISVTQEIAIAFEDIAIHLEKVV